MTWVAAMQNVSIDCRDCGIGHRRSGSEVADAAALLRKILLTEPVISQGWTVPRKI